jgi:hypothetical protein
MCRSEERQVSKPQRDKQLSIIGSVTHAVGRHVDSVAAPAARSQATSAAEHWSIKNL